MKSLIFALSLILLGSAQVQAQVYVGDSYDSNSAPPTVYYRNGKPYVPGYGNNSNTPRGQANTVEVGRPYPYYYGYPGYGYGYGPYNDGNTVVVGQPYYGGYGYGYGPYNDGNTVVVGQPYYGYGYFGY
ncbi:MAG TPA: hypothetical protein VJR29_12415 [bacterium]|nr:hypothetical protein [bacterium]